MEEYKKELEAAIYEGPDGRFHIGGLVLKSVLERFAVEYGRYCRCDFTMIMRDAISDTPFCSECGKEIKE